MGKNDNHRNLKIQDHFRSQKRMYDYRNGNLKLNESFSELGMSRVQQAQMLK
jgi:hypothetical protein